MPIAEFRLPDGRIAEFRVPEGTTPEQAIAFANDYIAKNPNQFAPPPVSEVQAQAPTPPLAAAAPSTPPVPGGEPSIFDYFTDREDAIARERASRARLQETLQQAEREDIATQTGFLDRLGDFVSRGVLTTRSGLKDVEAAIETDPALKAQFTQEARRFAADSAMPITDATTEEDVKENFLRNAIPYIVEKGAESLPQMLAATNPLGVLGVALPSNIGSQAREAAGLEGRTDVSSGDVAAVAPGGAAVTALDALGLGGILAAPAKTALGRIGKAALLEGVTEAIQSAIEYVNPRVVTGSDVDAGDLFERAAFGALAGSGIGGGLRATGEVITAPFSRGEQTEELPAGVTNAINKDPYDPQVLDEATQSLINNGVTPELAARVVANQAERARLALEAEAETDDGIAGPDTGRGESSVSSDRGAGAVPLDTAQTAAAPPPGLETAGRPAGPAAGRAGTVEPPLSAEQAQPTPAPAAEPVAPPTPPKQVDPAYEARALVDSLSESDPTVLRTVANLYERGLPIEDISRRTGLDTGTVSTIRLGLGLPEAGVEPSPLDDFAGMAAAERQRAETRTPVADTMADFDLDTFEPDMTPVRDAPSMKEKVPAARAVVTDTLGQMQMDLQDPVIVQKVIPQAARQIAQRADKPNFNPTLIIRTKLEEHGVELPPAALRAAPEGVGTPTSAPMESGAVALPRFPTKPATELTPEQEDAIQRVEPGVAQGITTQAMQQPIPAEQRERAAEKQEEARATVAEGRKQTIEERIASIASTYDALPTEKRVEAFEDAGILDPGDPAGAELAARSWADLNSSEKFNLANTLYVESEAEPLSASAVDYTVDKPLSEIEQSRQRMGERLMAARSSGKISNAQYAQLTNMLRPTSAMAERGAELRVTPATIIDVGTKLDALVKQNKGKDMRSDVFYSLAPNAFRGYEGGGRPRRRQVRANQRFTKLNKLFADGRLTPTEYVEQASKIAADMAQAADDKAFRETVTPLERGADIVREKLLAASRRGELDPGDVEFALWVIGKNPAMAEGVAISVRQTPKGKEQTAGDYNPLSAVMRIFKGHGAAGTEVHEILHHTERMMPEHIQRGIADAWGRAYAKALAKSTGKQREALQLILPAVAGDSAARASLFEAFADGTLDVDTHYQLFNPSEFWAVNATRILNNRYDAATSKKPWVRAARQWLSEFVERAKGWFGLRSDSAILAGLREVLATEGLPQASKYRSIVDVLGGRPTTQLENIAPTPSGPSGVNAKALEQIALSNTSTGMGEGVGAAINSKDPPKPIFTALKDNWRSMKPGLIGTLAKGMPTSAVTDIIEGELPIIREINNMMRTSESTYLRYNRSFSRLVDRVNTYMKENKSSTALGDTMHLSRLLRYNPLAHSSLQDALAKDVVIRCYQTLLGKSNLTDASKKEYTEKLNSRAESLGEFWKFWDALGKQKGGHTLYKDIAQFYRNMYNVQRTLLDERIMRLPISQIARLDLLDAIRLEYEKARTEPDEAFPELQVGELPEAYFPFMRHGDYWLRIQPDSKDSESTELYFFDSAKERDDFARTRAKELGADLSMAGEAILVGNDLQELRDKYFVGGRGESAALKTMFSIIDTSAIDTPDDKTALKDQLYQVYLNTLPERSIRKQFIHSKNRTGFSADIFRNVQASASRYANQLTDLEYADQLRGLIDQAKLDAQNTAAVLDRPRLAEYVKTMEDRVDASLNPGAPNAIVNGLNRFSFLWLLTSAGTAGANLASVPMRVLPRLASIYGYGNTLKLFTKYSRMWDTFGVVEKHPDGSVTHHLSMLNSAIVKKNPLLRRAADDLRNSVAILDTPVTEILRTQDSPMRPEGSIAKTKEAAVRVMSGLFNVSDRMAREMSSLMAFELDYNKARKEGLDTDAAYDRALNTAIDTVERTLGITSEYERPPIMRGPVARAVFLFKFYAVQQTKFLVETTYKSFAGATPAERSQAMQELTGALLMGAMFHGMVGLPLFSTIAAAIDLILEGIEDDEDREQRLLEDETTAFSSADRFRYNILPKYFGDITIKGLDGVERPLSLYLEMGPISAWTGGNIGSRTSMDNLWIREGEAGETYAESFKNFLLANLGPSVSLGEDMARAVDDFARGDIQRGVEKILPAFAKAPATAVRLAVEGEKTPRGDTRVAREELPDLSIVQAGLGVQPTTIANLKRRQFQRNDFENKAQRAKTAAQQRLNVARYKGDSADLAAALDQIDDHNRKFAMVPRLLITSEDIAASWDTFRQQPMVRGMRVTKEQAMSAAEAIGKRMDVPE